MKFCVSIPVDRIQGNVFMAVTERTPGAPTYDLYIEADDSYAVEHVLRRLSCDTERALRQCFGVRVRPDCEGCERPANEHPRWDGGPGTAPCYRLCDDRLVKA